MRRGLFIACLVFGLTAFIHATASAQGGRISMGKLKIIPSLGLDEVYDSNIYLKSGSDDAANAKVSDWIFHITPGMLFDYTLEGRGSIKLGYRGDWAFYSENSQNDWNDQEGWLDFDYKAPGGLILGLKNLYANLSDPYGAANQFGLGAPQTKRWYDDLGAKVGYNFADRYRVFAYYDYYIQKYKLESDSTQNWKNNVFGGGFEMHVAPKTWGFVRLFYGDRKYFDQAASTGVTDQNNGDFTFWESDVGLTWDSGAKFSGEVSFGYYWRNYDNEFDSQGNQFDDVNTWVAATRINYFATSTTTISLDLIRALRDTGSNTNQYYTDTGIALGLAQVFLRRFTLSLKGAYARYDYNVPSDPDMVEDNYLASVGLDYRILEWLTAGVAYTYLRQTCDNYPDNEYTDNRFIISLRAVY